ncbi:MAG: hypothetical protein NTX22_13020 [Ignavibacteriales bacterium]|nr:hypothetical protein [Ignavibacteriales bacterium]
MKRSKLFFLLIILLPLTIFITLETGCKKDESNPANSTNNGNNQTDANQVRGENWLLGTWEGITPGDATPPLNNKKVRIIFTAVKLSSENNPQRTQTNRIYAYTGTITWDADGNGQWTMAINANDFPAETGGGTVIWECTTFKPSNQFTEHISLGAHDTANTAIRHGVSLNWGPMISTTSASYTYLDFYGDIEVDSGSNERIEFSPDKMLRLTKK